VRKLSVDGIITRFEGFDVDGERIIQLFDAPWPKPPLS
jgi:putative heme degradation protein